jgi:DNA-directed RNA polymerase specialized sigma24 family protein
VEGYTAKEIGRMTRESRGTILSRIHRAREKLRNDKRLRSELDGREIIGEQGKEKV